MDILDASSTDEEFQDCIHCVSSGFNFKNAQIDQVCIFCLLYIINEHFNDDIVREFAVSRLHYMTDDDIEFVMPQLCQFALTWPLERAVSVINVLIARCATCIHFSFKLTWWLEAAAFYLDEEAKTRALEMSSFVEISVVNARPSLFFTKAVDSIINLTHIPYFNEDGEIDYREVEPFPTYYLPPEDEDDNCSSFITKQVRSEFFNTQLNYFKYLKTSSESLTKHKRPTRKKLLPRYLENYQPYGLYFPLFDCADEHHKIRRIFPNDGVVLNSRDKAPFLLWAEVEYTALCSGSPDIYHAFGEVVESQLDVAAVAEAYNKIRKRSMVIMPDYPSVGVVGSMAAVPAAAAARIVSDDSLSMIDPSDNSDSSDDFERCPGHKLDDDQSTKLDDDQSTSDYKNTTSVEASIEDSNADHTNTNIEPISLFKDDKSSDILNGLYNEDLNSPPSPSLASSTSTENTNTIYDPTGASLHAKLTDVEIHDIQNHSGTWILETIEPKDEYFQQQLHHAADDAEASNAKCLHFTSLDFVDSKETLSGNRLLNPSPSLQIDLETQNDNTITNNNSQLLIAESSLSPNFPFQAKTTSSLIVSQSESSTLTPIISTIKFDPFGETLEQKEERLIYNAEVEVNIEKSVLTPDINISSLSESRSSTPELPPSCNRTHLLSVIFKGGDDCRQEVLAMQLINMFDIVWTNANLPLLLRPYAVLVTSADSGLIETVPNTVSIDSLKKSEGFVSIEQFFHDYFGPGGKNMLDDAIQGYVQSMAAYSLVSYFLQIKDRHNGNIMLDNEGRIVHIDFGFMLSSSPGGNSNFEDVPFKLTAEYIQVMGGQDSPYFHSFTMYVVQGFLAVREHAHKFLSLVELMQDSAMMAYVAGGKKVISDLKSRFALDLSHEKCVEHVIGLVNKSCDHWRSVQYDKYQYVTNGIL